MRRRDFLACSAGAALSLRMPASPARAETALPVQEIADGVYGFAGTPALMTAANRGEICNLGFVVGQDAVAVIDSGGSVLEARALIAAIGAVTDRPIRYLINTHMHPDHVFGNAAFADIGCEIIGHRNLPRALASHGEFYLANYRAAMGAALMADIRIIPPSRRIDRDEELDLGNRKLTLTAWKPAHTDNDLTVLDAQTGTLFTGDLCFVDHLPTLDGSLLGWIAQLDTLAAMAATKAVPGHGPVPSLWPEALMPERRYFDALTRDLRKAIADGVPLGEAVVKAAAGERPNWHLFDEYNIRNATAAFAELEWE